MSKLDELIQELCPDGVEFKQLSEAVSIERGKRVTREQLSADGKYPVYQNSLTPLGFYSQYNYPANTTFIIVAGAAGEIGYSTTKFWSADDCFPLVCGDDILSRYLYHVIMNQKPIIMTKVRKASIPRLSRSAIEKLKIPVPPLEVQREVVHILDNFSETTQKLEEELRAELAARQKQYEYYRDKLLTFGVRGGAQVTLYGGRLEKCAASKRGKPSLHMRFHQNQQQSIVFLVMAAMVSVVLCGRQINKARNL